jgi:anaerobic selenocysteine-containing dehydrogenase
MTEAGLDESVEATHLRTCPLCEAMCGLEVLVRDGTVARIRADRDDVWSKGYLCPKGTTLGHLHHDPDRVRVPMVRQGATWSEVSWPEAFAECERLLRGVIDRHGIGAVTAYVGNPTAHNFSLGRYVAAFMPMSGIPQIYSAGTVDQWPKNVVSALLYGRMWSIPAPDLDRTSYLLMLGANPAASQGSLLACADVLGRLDAIRARGGKVVLVDPRRTETAEHASEWLPIRPGTDAALLMAMATVLFDDGLVALRHLDGLVDGVDAVRGACAPFTPESVEALCRIPAATIRRLAHDLAAAEAGAAYARIGTCNQEFGTLASWMVEVLNILTGNLDRPGGSMFANPIAWPLVNIRPPEFTGGYSFGRWRSRVRGAPEVLGQYPVSCLAEEIATPDDGPVDPASQHQQVRALITIAGNPVISSPDAARLDEALPMLECMISIDNYLNETSRHAHVLLPGNSALEQPHYDDLIWMWAIRNAGKFSPAVFPTPDRPAEWEILLTIAAICLGVPLVELDVAALDDAFFGGVVALRTAEAGSPIEGRDPEEVAAATGGHGPERMLDFAIRTGPWGDHYGAEPGGLTLQSFRDAPHGIDMGPLEPRLADILDTPNGRIDLAPDHIVADVPRLLDRMRRDDGDGLVLVSRRHLRSNNSWMHNVKVLVKGKERCTLLVHPDDARRYGLVDGGTAQVASEAGRLVAPVEVTDEMMPGVVSLPHGWGHDKPGTRLAVAREHAGVNNNVLAPGHLVDVPSGNQVVNGIPVEVAPA